MLIFNLHHIEPRSNTAAFQSRRHITITPNGLRRFIKTLRLAGLEIISLRQALEDGLDDPNAAPRKETARQVILTIDDGYVNNLKYAAPVLQSENAPATIFVLPGRFGGSNEWDQGNWPEENRDPLMTLEQMQELVKQYPCITYSSHGLRHVHMDQISSEALHKELHESHQILSDNLGETYLPTLAYPWGDYSQDVLKAMETSPYRCAFTVVTAPWEAGTPRFEIPRYSVFYRDGNPIITLAKLMRHGILLPNGLMKIKPKRTKVEY